MAVYPNCSGPPFHILGILIKYAFRYDLSSFQKSTYRCRICFKWRGLRGQYLNLYFGRLLEKSNLQIHGDCDIDSEVSPKGYCSGLSIQSWKPIQNSQDNPILVYRCLEINRGSGCMRHEISPLIPVNS